MSDYSKIFTHVTYIEENYLQNATRKKAKISSKKLYYARNYFWRATCSKSKVFYLLFANIN